MDVKKLPMEELLSDFSEDTASGFAALVNNIAFSTLYYHGNDAYFNFENSSAYRRTLILKNVTEFLDVHFPVISFGDDPLTKDGDVYVLSGTLENFFEDSEKPFSIRFTDASVQIEVYKADYKTYDFEPWGVLSSLAEEIIEKSYVSADLLNYQENELLPLLSEICDLFSLSRSWIEGTDWTADFQNLKEYLVRYNYIKPITILDRIEKIHSKIKKWRKTVRKLTKELNKKQYEPLWREIHDTIRESQKDYPNKLDSLYPKEKLCAVREKIQALMEGYGYSGTYPDFVKKHKLIGTRIAESHGKFYFVGKEENVVSHIKCCESYFNNRFEISFKCGTALLRDGEHTGDVFSCMFECNGRSFFNEVCCEFDYINTDGEMMSDDIESRVRIAVKRAELTKLTKEDNREFYGADYSPFKRFL